MILTNNSIPQFQNGLKGNTIPDTELKYFAKARFIHFTAAHVFDIVYLQSQDRIHGNTAARAVSTCIWSRCVPDRIAVCGSDTQGRRTRTPAGNSTFGTGRDFQRKRRLKKRERKRSVGMNQEKGGDSGSTLISQIHFWLVPRTVDTQPSTSTIFHIFFTRSPPPCFYFNRGSHLARKTRRHFPEMSTEKLKPSSYFNLVFPWNLRVNRETRSERSYIFYGITDFDIALISKYEIYIFIENLSDIYNIYIFKSIDN